MKKKKIQMEKKNRIFEKIFKFLKKRWKIKMKKKKKLQMEKKKKLIFICQCYLKKVLQQSNNKIITIIIKIIKIINKNNNLNNNLNNNNNNNKNDVYK